MSKFQLEPCLHKQQHPTKNNSRCEPQQQHQQQQAGTLGSAPVNKHQSTAGGHLQQRTEVHQQVGHQGQRAWPKRHVQKQERYQQQQAAQHRQQTKAATSTVSPPDSGPLLVRVANSTSAYGLAHQLINRLKQQLKVQSRKEKHISTGLLGMHDSSRSTGITLQCSSGASLYNALQAIGVAAQQAACLQQPQQLLLQPQLVHNALDTAADGKRGAGAYQLLLLWIPAAACSPPSQAGAQMQWRSQQRCSPEVDQPPRRLVKLQDQRHPLLPQPHSAIALLDSRPSACTAAALSSSASSARLLAGTQHTHLLQCDVPAIASSSRPKGTRKKRPKRKSKQMDAASSRPQSISNSSSSNSTCSRQFAQSLSWRVSNLLRGGWTAGLSCCSAADALVAVKALVKARKQLAAGGVDLLVAVQMIATPTAPAQAAAELSIVLTVAGFTVQQSVAVDADAGAMSSSSRRLHGQAEFVQTSAAQWYLEQQQQRRHTATDQLSTRHRQQQQQEQSSPLDTARQLEG